jgi:Cu/Ag efflux protein CusF
VSGTVQSVDAQAHTLTVGAGAGNQMNLRNSDRTVLTYDSSTVVEYQGQKSYNPEDLEVGDQIEAQVERSGDRLLARNIKVVYSVSGNSGTNSGAATAWDATVRSVNSRNRTIELVQSGRNNIRLRFTTMRTRVSNRAALQA